MRTKFIIFVVLVVLIVGGYGFYMNNKAEPVGKYDVFAQCIKASGAQFFGAFWCSHCQEQKADFGSSKQYLPYVECANPDNTQTQVCIDNKIEGYPLWVFSNGERLSGRLPLETLAEKTECFLPQ